MSLSFSSEQYNQEFTPKRLGMYEVPKEQLSKVPKSNIGLTKFIANNNGYLLEGAKRSDSNPFGDFLGTWDLPKKIPGPYKINPTARSTKNLKILETQKAEVEKEMKEALEAQKPLRLRKQPQQHQHENHQQHGDNVYYNPTE